MSKRIDKIEVRLDELEKGFAMLGKWISDRNREMAQQKADAEAKPPIQMDDESGDVWIRPETGPFNP